MRGILLVLLALTKVTQLLGQEHTVAAMLKTNADTDNNKSLEFAKIIREDLRRNNDDYVAGAGLLGRQEYLLPNAMLPTRPPLYHEALTRHPPNRGPLTHNQRKLSIDTRRALNNTKDQTTDASKILNATSFRSNTRYPAKRHKKDRVVRLKRLINRENSRLKALGRTATTPIDGANTADLTTPAGDTTAVISPSSPVTITRPREAALRQYVKTVPPLPDELDMAPARGPAIRRYRNRGRLCQRNLLHLEGPKYNRGGRTVKMELQKKQPGGRSFYTRKPKLVLPRCCNCCKKSVLGCQ